MSEFACPRDGCEYVGSSGNSLKVHFGQAHDIRPKGIDAEDLGRIDELIHCPHDGCKRVFYKERGVESHYGRVHGGSIRKVKTECAQCGEELLRLPCKIRRSENHFCGDKNCQDKWQEEGFAGENNPNWQDAKIEVECAHCGKVERELPSQMKNQERHFCKTEHHDLWRSENKRGPNAPAWKGGYPNYGEGWSTVVRERVRDRQDRRCAGCGANEDENGERLSVHHIQPPRMFDDDRAANDESNLVALCRDCHHDWERLSPLRPQTPHLD